VTAARGTAAEAVPTQAPRVTGGEPERAAFLEAALGDPFDPGNPHGQLALLRADDARAVPEATEALLAEAGLGAEFVPHDLGGRLTDLERLARVLRPVFRRDLALGYGFGITSLFAASSVWTAGDDDQRRAVARVLLGGGRVSIVHRQIAHANAILRNELAATRTPDGGFVLNGRKDAVINADRTDVFVTYARTDAQDGPGSHSVLLLGPEPPVSGRVRRSRRVETSGMRGARFCGIELTDVALPASAVVGSVGEGVSLALRSFQISHCLVPGTVVACVDGVLRQAVRAATENRPGGQPARRRHKAITGVFADLLACDAMAVTGLRALSLAPRDAYVPAAAVKYTMPDLLREDLDEMAAVLGARGYDRGPHYGGFQKLARDLPVAGLGHSGTALCQAVIVPQLSTLARTVWFRSAEPPAELFDPGAPLPVFDHRRLAHSGTDDLLSATLADLRRRAAGAARPVRGPARRGRHRLRPAGLRPGRPLRAGAGRRGVPGGVGGPGRRGRRLPRGPGLGGGRARPPGQETRRPGSGRPRRGGVLGAGRGAGAVPYGTQPRPVRDAAGRLRPARCAVASRPTHPPAAPGVPARGIVRGRAPQRHDGRGR
jgi:alkylation response protein AidB-like acyl-CoA dehydrogenase